MLLKHSRFVALLSGALLATIVFWKLQHSSRTSFYLFVDVTSHRTKSGSESQLSNEGQSSDEMQTSDGWPHFSRNYYPHPIPQSPFHPDFTILWDFNISRFLQRPDVQGQPYKIITWIVKKPYVPSLPEPVRLRTCPEMPCLMTTNTSYQNKSAALLWAGQKISDETPPKRSNLDQVFVFHNHEPQTRDWVNKSIFYQSSWKSVFNWTMHYRFDSDIVDLYGYLAKRHTPLVKNYTEILAKKTKFAAWIVSHCKVSSRREDYVRLLQRYVPVDVYGSCGPFKCPRDQDELCLQKISTEYKFYLSLENAFCRDYITEKFFRYLGADVVVVARGSNDYGQHAPPGIFINTADFKSTKDLAGHLLYLDSHPEEYLKILMAKDAYQPLFEEYPIRNEGGQIRYMAYHYEAVSFCEMCRRLWDVDMYRKVIPNIGQWLDKGNCYPPNDLK